MAFRAAATISTLTLVAADQCKVEHNITYSNCWGDDLDGEPADTLETCCQRCAEIPHCEVFTFDVWNKSGAAEPYCFFKYGCSEPRYSDSAISGILDRPSTEKTTKAPTTTRTPTTAPVTTKAPAGSTTPSAEQPQCTAPSSVTAMGVAKAKQLNVSRWEDCCSSCAPPACSYVTFGKYRGASEETWACFHFAEAANAGAVHLDGSAFLMLRDDKAATCEDLGLKSCGASPVSVSPGPRPVPSASTSPVVLGAAGGGVFLVTIPVGYFLSKMLGFGGK